MRIVRLVAPVIGLDLRRGDRHGRRFPIGRQQHVLDPCVFAEPAILRVGRLRRDHQRVGQCALHLLEGDLSGQLVLKFGSRLESHGARHVTGVKLLSDEFAVGVEHRDLQDLLPHLVGSCRKVETSRLLQHQVLIDQPVHHLLGQAHAGDHLRRQRLAIHLLIVLL